MLPKLKLSLWLKQRQRSMGAASFDDEHDKRKNALVDAQLERHRKEAEAEGVDLTGAPDRCAISAKYTHLAIHIEFYDVYHRGTFIQSGWFCASCRAQIGLSGFQLTPRGKRA